MSAFLGPIHYWMYNKIKWHYELLEKILYLAETKDFSTIELKNEMISSFGNPVAGDLADVIAHNNIHGWLQEQVSSVESRIATTVTKLLNYNIVSLDELMELYYQFGKDTFNNTSMDIVTPKNLYSALNNCLLEGMPCDGINQIVQTEESEFAWIRMKCIHEQYWNSANGKIDIFYQLRDALINGFVEAAGVNFEFVTTAEGINIIREV